MLNKMQRNKYLLIKVISTMIVYYTIQCLFSIYADSISSEQNEIVSEQYSTVNKDEIFQKMEKEVSKLINTQTDDVALEEIEPSHELVSLDSYVNVKTDESVIQEKDKVNQSKEFVLCESIYCDDYYIAKYINEAGEFKTLIAEYKDNNIEVYPRERFTGNKNIEYSNNIIGKYITENEYAERIKEVIDKVYSGNVDISKESTDLFTDGALAELLDKANSENIKGISEKNLEFMIFGKSSTDIEHINRVYIQMGVVKDNKNVYSDLEFRINEDGIIFDVDTL